MARYQVYLEVGEDGRAMAHVVDLPGCIGRSETREETLDALPEAIGAYQGWLRRHGEDAPPAAEPIELEVVGETLGEGPFDPGDRAALFPPDREPVTPEEMEWYFRLMGYNRKDLLALAGEPSDELLDWRPFPGSYNLRRILRHVGNGDKWYVSRIVPVETLPPEWDEDEDLPPGDYLEMSRRTAIARLRALTEEERGGIFYPTFDTEHPDEPWTARKVLRRALEHEREHMAQAREILAARRRLLMARMARGRVGLLAGLLGMDEKTLTEAPVVDEWTVKDLLAHIAAWDRWEARTMEAMAAGGAPDLSVTEDYDGANAVFVEAARGQSLESVLDELREARAEWVAWMRSLPEEVFFAPRSYQGDDLTFSGELPVFWEHEAEHARQIATWRAVKDLKGGSGSKMVMLAALEAAREDLLAAAALVPAEGRDSWPVCGSWTLKDVLGHVADWERFAYEGLGMMAAGQTPDVERVDDIEAWNQAHAEARRAQPWEVVWDDLTQGRQALMALLGGMEEAQLARRFDFPWGVEGTAYDWLGVFVEHDREHARDFHLGGGD